MNTATNVNLPTPDFSFPEPFRCVAGLRPFRKDGYRLEVDRSAASSGKFLVHNYGHGGAGITLSWGSASQVRDLVRAHLATSTDRKVAVLGSGVMGLTVAILLLELGLEVTIYAKQFWSDTTSAIAGGQWAVSKVDHPNAAQFKDIVEVSYRTFKDSIGKGFGVSDRPNYATASGSPNLDIVLQISPGLIPPPQRLPRLPFEHHTKPGWVYQTLLVEPPIFLKRLDDDLRARNVPFVTRTFSTVADVLALQENIIVNCTGLGSKKIWNDQQLQPIKGQLALLPGQPALNYLYGQNGYMFPRTDVVVIGGSFELDFTTTDPDPDFCKLLVDYMKGQFGKGPEIPLPDIHIHHPDNLPKAAPGAIAVA